MIHATGAQIITGILERQGIKTVAGIPGGAVVPLYDELARSSLTHILVRQEQAGGFMAQGIARTTGKPAVCIATSGPGAMNLLTAIADARSDSIPMIAITGQVNRNLIGTDAFQEIDTFGLSMPITKHSVMVKSARELLTELPKAFRIASEGRPGPVLIDVPRDVQLEVAFFEQWPEIAAFQKPDAATIAANPETANLIEKAVQLFSNSKNPVLFCGGGSIVSEGSSDLIRQMAEKFSIPVCSSLMGLGIMPTSHKLFCGMVGMHGSFCANKIMHESDLIIAVGVRFDDRATGLVAQFCPNAKIIHIDIDAAEINKIYQSDVALPGDTSTLLSILYAKLTERLGQLPWNKAGDIEKRIAEYKSRPVHTYHNNEKHPSAFMPRIANLCSKVQKNQPYIVTDVGQHQMFTAQCYPFSFPRQFLTSGSLGTMGFGLPTANGAALANPDHRVICFSGDGSILMNIQELATLAEENLNVTVIVLDNSCLGMVRQQQEFICKANYSASIYKKNPDLVKIAEGFNIPSFDITDWNKFDSQMTEALSGTGPRFVRIPVEQSLNVYPYVLAGRANIDAAGISK